MAPQRKSSQREYWGMALLLIILLVSALYFNKIGQDVTGQSEPSSLNTQQPGAKALFLLLKQEGFRVDQLETTWSGLPSDAGLLVVIEPFDRERQAISNTEIQKLHEWIVQGGTLLYCAADPPRPLEPSDSVAGDVEIVRGQSGPVIATPLSGSSLTRNVRRAVFDSPVRLRPAPSGGYSTLFKDKVGALVVTKPLGHGHVIVAASGFAASNAGVRGEDNALFLIDIAQTALGHSSKAVYFDEYHHGHGLEDAAANDSESEMTFLPLSARLVFGHLLLVGAVVVYNGNRRFGRPLGSGGPHLRAPSDYVGSMARLLRRAGAADVALNTLYQMFHRDLRRQLDLGPNDDIAKLVHYAVRKYGVDEGAFRDAISRCEAVSHGERISETEMMKLARQLEEFRRKCKFVGS